MKNKLDYPAVRRSGDTFIWDRNILGRDKITLSHLAAATVELSENMKSLQEGLSAIVDFIENSGKPGQGMPWTTVKVLRALCWALAAKADDTLEYNHGAVMVCTEIIECRVSMAEDEVPMDSAA